MADKETNNNIKSRKLIISNLDSYIEVSQLHNSFAYFWDVISYEIPTYLIEKEDEKKWVSWWYGHIISISVEI